MQIDDIMQAANLSKTRLAEKMNTDIVQLERLLAPDNTSITLDSLARLARAVGNKNKLAACSTSFQSIGLSSLPLHSPTENSFIFLDFFKNIV